ncbi:hypothetical protein [Klebsiella pneumoniae]|uniref:hypothetical protein n=1 Tax=Klebsiella pneumoniae TaxID=573 RepID=UPI001E352079|nr:hypothetical protein [Klebsiella pneumoniae]MDQ6483972.1 hypothetical protein [Klebsiella pneumoniae]
MINRSKLEHILEYAKQQRHIGQSCKVPPEDMVEIMERLLSACNPPVIPDGYVMVPKVATEKMLIAGLEEANPLGGLIDWDASRGDCNTREQVQEIFKAMLAAAPQEVKGE